MSSALCNIKHCYIKHASFQLCTASIQKMQDSQNKVSIHVSHNKLQTTDHYEVILNITVINKKDDKTFFIVKVKQAGIFIVNKQISEEHRKKILAVNCSYQLYCYASYAISQIMKSANIEKTILTPVDFNVLYQMHQNTSQFTPKKRHYYYNQMGRNYFKNEDYEQAIDCYKKALIEGENCVAVFFNLGMAYWKLNRFHEAIAAYKKAIEIDPFYVKAIANLAFTLTHINRLIEAEHYYRLALSRDSTNADYYGNLGVNYKKQNKIEEAIDCFEKSLSLKPNVAKNQVNEALCLLSKGDFFNGWEKYENRFALEELEKYADHHFSQPRWLGENFQNKTLLVHVEQGLGDIIQFIRYLPLVARQGGKIILVCYRRLIPLLEKVKEDLKIDELIPDINIERCPSFDYHISLLSLPRIFKTNLENIPFSEGYIFLPKTDCHSRESGNLIKNNKKLKVGIAWAGNKKHKEDRNRSMKLEYFKPLFLHDHITFYSLQYGNRTLEIYQNELSDQFIDLSKNIHNFYDTARFIEQLDLVITVDTAIAHLSGAMGKPTWVLLSFSPDFRWLLDRANNPWYKSIRLFRQPTIDDWESVISNVHMALQEQRLKI